MLSGMLKFIKKLLYFKYMKMTMKHLQQGTAQKEIFAPKYYCQQNILCRSNLISIFRNLTPKVTLKSNQRNR